MARKNLPRRKKNDSKAHGGHLLVVGGSPGLAGAAILAARASAYSGAGYTHILTRMERALYLHYPDFLIQPLKNVATLKRYNPDALVVGPGLGSRPLTQKVIISLLKRKVQNVVLDAEALNALSQMPSKQKLPDSWILTPHIGEMARLLKRTTQEISKSPQESAIAAQKKFGGIVLLKGPDTWIVTSQVCYLCQSGKSALAKAGTGDVLAGIIGGFLAQGMLPINATTTAAYVHGLVSQVYLKKGNDHLSLTPSKLIELIPQTLRKLRRTR